MKMLQPFGSNNDFNTKIKVLRHGKNQKEYEEVIEHKVVTTRITNIFKSWTWGIYTAFLERRNKSYIF